MACPRSHLSSLERVSSFENKLRQTLLIAKTETILTLPAEERSGEGSGSKLK